MTFCELGVFQHRTLFPCMHELLSSARRWVLFGAGHLLCITSGHSVVPYLPTYCKLSRANFYLMKNVAYSHGRTGRKKLGGRKQICPTFRILPDKCQKIFPERIYLYDLPPPPRRQKNFGQCTILGVQKFFGHTKIFRNIILIFPMLWNFPKKWQNLSHFFYIKPILPDCRANIARLAWFAQQTGGAGAPPAPPPGTPMHIVCLVKSVKF